MKDTLKINSEFQDIIEYFNSYDIPIESIYTFIDKNLEFIIKNKDSICDKLYFIMNKNDIYGIIYSNENNYYWSILNKGVFSKLSTVNLDKQSDDYIVDMIINFSDSDKLLALMPDINNYTLENRLKILKKIKLNSNGYHIK